MSSPEGWTLEKENKSYIEWENRDGDALVILRKKNRGNWHLFYPTGETQKGLNKEEGRSKAVDWMRDNPMNSEKKSSGSYSRQY